MILREIASHAFLTFDIIEIIANTEENASGMVLEVFFAASRVIEKKCILSISDYVLTSNSMLCCLLPMSFQRSGIIIHIGKYEFVI